MASSQPLVLLTGGSGFIGSWILSALLHEGYRVRALARGSNVAAVKKTHAQAGDRLEVVEIKDLVKDDLSKVFEGVDFLIHTAAPVPGRTLGREQLYNGHSNGVVNVVGTAAKSGVKKIVLTGAFHALYGGNVAVTFQPGVLSEKDWGPEDLEIFGPDADIEDPVNFYKACHSIGEKKFWKLADEYPHVDFTSILPSMVYGRYIPGYPEDAKGTVGSNRFMYSLLVGDPGAKPGEFPSFDCTQQVHAIDVAKAHIKALETLALPSTDGRRKRFVISQGIFSYADAIRLLKKERPELSWRLPDENDPAGDKQCKKELDNSFAEEILGMKKADYISGEETLLDTIDSLVAWEKVVGREAVKP